MARYYSEMRDMRTCVYRLYDPNGCLLYVGLSMNVPGRMAKHRRRDWWGQVEQVELEWFADREAAKQAERDAIANENPIHNITRPRLEAM